MKKIFKVLIIIGLVFLALLLIGLISKQIIKSKFPDIRLIGVTPFSLSYSKGNDFEIYLNILNEGHVCKIERIQIDGNYISNVLSQDKDKNFANTLILKGESVIIPVKLYFKRNIQYQVADYFEIIINCGGYGALDQLVERRQIRIYP